MLLLYNLLFSNKHNFVPLSHWDSSNSVGAFVPLFCTFWFQATGWVWMFSMSLWPGSRLKVWWTSKPFSSHRGPLAKVIWRPRLMSTLKTLAHAASAQVSSPENDVAKLKPGVGFSLSCLLLCYCVKHQTKSNLGVERVYLVSTSRSQSSTEESQGKNSSRGWRRLMENAAQWLASKFMLGYLS